jgi:hypothetical protein
LGQWQIAQSKTSVLQSMQHTSRNKITPTAQQVLSVERFFVDGAV